MLLDALNNRSGEIEKIDTRIPLKNETFYTRLQVDKVVGAKILIEKGGEFMGEFIINPEGKIIDGRRDCSLEAFEASKKLVTDDIKEKTELELSSLIKKNTNWGPFLEKGIQNRED